MALFDSIAPGGSRDFRRRLLERSRGQGTQASAAFATARRANAKTARRGAATAQARGVNAALAQRQAGQAQAEADAGAAQAFTAQSIAERERAAAQLAQLDEQRRGFRRKLVSSLMRGAQGAVGALGIGSPEDEGTKFAGGNLFRSGGQAAGTALGGPLGGMAGGALGDAAGKIFTPSTGGEDPGKTMAVVDQALARGPISPRPPAPPDPTQDLALIGAHSPPPPDPAAVAGTRATLDRLLDAGPGLPRRRPEEEEGADALEMFRRLFGGR